MNREIVLENRKGLYYTTRVIAIRDTPERQHTRMGQGHLERRRSRRATVEAPVVIRRLDPSKPQVLKDHTTRDVSLAGLYFETEHGDRLSANDIILASIAIPEPQTRAFPFTRLSGRGRVVRVHELSTQDAERKRFGVAVEFMEDLTALSAIPRTG